MLLLTTDTLPPGYSIVNVFGFVEQTTAIEISEKSLLRKIFEDKSNGTQGAIDNLIIKAMQMSQGKGNLIYGVKVTSATAMYDNGAFLYLTHIGTVAEVRHSDNRE